MIQILTYNEINKQQWQLLVEHSPCATWFQTPEAYTFYASLPNEMTPFAVAVENNGKLRAVCVGYTTKEANTIKQYLTCRAIIIGGPVIADDATDEEVAALMQAIRRLGDKTKGKKNSKAVTIASTPYTLHPTPIYIETRNFNDYSRWKSVLEQNGFAYQPHLNFHVDCTQDNMLATMSESRRRQIKKAIKSGVEIVEAKSCDEVKEFYTILLDLYTNKVKTPLFPLDFFLMFFEQNCGKYLLVKYADKIIGGIMCPIFKGQTIYEWFVCGMDEQYKNQYPSVMATYAAIEYANQHGLSCFDFMGAGKPDEAYGVRDFKARFGGELVEHGRFLCIRKPLLYYLGKLGVKLLKMKR